MKFLVAKHLGSLRPVDQAGEDALRKIGQGQLVEIELRRPRNIRFHRLYWALITIVWDQLDEQRYPSVEDLHAAIKIAAGLRTRIELPDGTVGFIPGSIAFHKMSADDFAAFFDRVCGLIVRHFLPGVTDAELRAEVEAMIGASPAPAPAPSRERVA
jgi:hypothetical protein